MLYRFLCTIFIFTICVSTYAQSIDKLDKANGFKEFKIGKPKSKWVDEIKPLKNGAYKYLGENAKAAFGSAINKLYLRFDSLGNLSGIYVSVKGLMGKDGVRGYKNIIGLAYGKESKMDDGDKKVKYYWFATKLNFVLSAWERGGTWDAELDFCSPWQYAADTSAQTNKAAD